LIEPTTTELDYLDYAQLPYAYGGPLGQAEFKSLPEDFVVEELLGFEPSGDGEHLWLYIEKRDANTNDVVRLLSRLCGVPQRQISYSGLKDRYAVTRQWFCLPDRHAQGLAEELAPGIRILQRCLNRKKLRQGSHRCNRFTITLRAVTAAVDQVEHRLQQIADAGVPNFFGFQRFGARQDNVLQALSWFRGETSAGGRQRRGLLISAVRSYLFNLILAERVRQQNWGAYLAGDILALAGSRTLLPEVSVEEAEQRIASGDVHPTAALWGEGEPLASALAGEIEADVFAAYPELVAGLRAQSAKLERRKMRLLIDKLNWRWLDVDKTPTLELQFELESGAYATVVLRELLRLQQTKPQAPVEGNKSSE
jgi:tRNA pseudouridine13 synthase